LLQEQIKTLQVSGLNDAVPGQAWLPQFQEQIRKQAMQIMLFFLKKNIDCADGLYRTTTGTNPLEQLCQDMRYIIVMVA